MRSLLAGLVTLSALLFAQTPAPWEGALAQQHWDQAEPLLKAALTEGETAPVLRGLVTVYRATGRIAATEPLLEKLVALEGSSANLEDLARIKASLGNLDTAETLYRRSLALRVSADIDPLASIPVRVRLAQVLVAEKKFPEAEQEALTAISSRARAAGANHPDLAGDNAVLARIFQVQKKWHDAAGAWETVAAIQSNAFGFDDPRVADTLDNLANCRAELQLFDQAESALRRALAIRELNLGPSNSDVAATTDQLGKLLYSAKRFGEAEALFRRTLNIYLSLGLDSALLARCYDNLAVTEAMLEKYAESEGLYREALKLRDYDDALSLRNVALVITAQRKNAEAQPFYSRALAVLDVGNYQDSDLLPVILSEYAGLLRDLKRPTDAGKLDQRLKGGAQVPPGKRPPVAAKQ
jgi:tetratricopeptide (TPR) repeat protein